MPNLTSDDYPPPQHPDGSDATDYTQQPLKQRLDDAEADTYRESNLNKNGVYGENGYSNMADKLINTGIFKRHQGSYPPARFPDHYRDMSRRGSWDAR